MQERAPSHISKSLLHQRDALSLFIRLGWWLICSKLSNQEKAGEEDLLVYVLIRSKARSGQGHPRDVAVRNNSFGSLVLQFPPHKEDFFLPLSPSPSCLFLSLLLYFFRYPMYLRASRNTAFDYLKLCQDTSQHCYSPLNANALVREALMVDHYVSFIQHKQADSLHIHHSPFETPVQHCPRSPDDNLLLQQGAWQNCRRRNRITTPPYKEQYVLRPHTPGCERAG